MNKYRKLFAAIIISAVFIVLELNDIRIMGLDGLALDLVQGALVALGVYQVPNEPMS